MNKQQCACNPDKNVKCLTHAGIQGWVALGNMNTK